MTPREFQETLKKRILITDGALGTMIQNLGYGTEIFGGEEFQMLSEMLVFSRPEALRNLHLQYFRAGSDAVQTNTIGASSLRLQEFDFSALDTSEFESWEGDPHSLSMDELAVRLNSRAAAIARAALDEHKRDPAYDGRELFVIGTLGPSNWVLSSTNADLKKGDFETIEWNFQTQALGLIEGGADILLFETQQDILELKAAILGAKKAMRDKKVDLPIIAQVTVDPFSRMPIFHTDILAAMATVQDLGIHAFGINCGLGPKQMEPTIEKLHRQCRLPISVVPNAGLPQSERGQTVYKLSASEFAHHMKTFVEDFGVNIVGGCCGTAPDHIRSLVESIRPLKPKQRIIEKTVFVSGPQQAIKLDSHESLIRIGERLNVRGSKKVRQAVENTVPIDQEALEEVVVEQTRELGVEIIDVCMDSNVVETASTLVEVVKAQTVDFPAAMSLDSFDVEALEKAVRIYPGRPIVNSISLEEYSPGVDKIDAVLNATKDHAPVYIALTTGPKGPAVTADEKTELARRILEKATTKHGVTAQQIIVDINAFPIGSEPEDDLNFALESIAAIPRIKKMDPDLKTIIGVGNLTNGLAKKPYMRKVLTSVFLDEARKKGLDAAIVNPAHYVPADSLPRDDYQLGKKVIMEHDMDAFAQLEVIALEKKGTVTAKKIDYDDLDPPASVCAKIKDGFKERTPGSLEINGNVHEYQDRIVLQVANIVENMEPLKLINDHLMPAMEELGAGFAAGTVSLPHLLKSADVMRQVMLFLEALIKTSTGGSDRKASAKGTVVLGTVYQDVHSIGKDLSKTLMENYGYQVIDLGVQVPVAKFVEAAREHRAAAVGMSALLVQTSNHMISVAALLEEQGLGHVPLLVGGAPVNQRHAAHVAMAGREDESRIRDDVFYCSSGMDGINYLNQLLDPTKKRRLLADNREKLIASYRSGRKREKKRDELSKSLPRRKVLFHDSPPSLKDFPPIQYLEYSMSDFLPYLKEDLLYTLNWKYGGKGSWERKGVRREDLHQKLTDWVRRLDEKKWMRPQAVYALFPCRGSQNAVTVLNPGTKDEICRLTFNNVLGKNKKDIFSVAQYFHPDREDIVGLQLSTAGTEVETAIRKMKDHDSESALILQGLANRVAEDMAEHANRLMEKYLFPGSAAQSARYSPGYPAMTDIENNQRIADLLDAVQHLGIELTSGYQFHPTGTTAAVVCFHPQAEYH
ncbi:MAG: dihydropteroate synthase [Proteobacteria bacterium]|nr:dihydropteroate synthase [Pseudomonadota bacterium]